MVSIGLLTSFSAFHWLQSKCIFREIFFVNCLSFYVLDRSTLDSIIFESVSIWRKTVASRRTGSSKKRSLCNKTEWWHNRRKTNGSKSFLMRNKCFVISATEGEIKSLLTEIVGCFPLAISKLSYHPWRIAFSEDIKLFMERQRQLSRENVHNENNS